MTCSLKDLLTLHVLAVLAVEGIGILEAARADEEAEVEGTIEQDGIDAVNDAIRQVIVGGDDLGFVDEDAVVVNGDRDLAEALAAGRKGLDLLAVREVGGKEFPCRGVVLEDNGEKGLEVILGEAGEDVLVDFVEGKEGLVGRTKDGEGTRTLEKRKEAGDLQSRSENGSVDETGDGLVSRCGVHWGGIRAGGRSLLLLVVFLESTERRGLRDGTGRGEKTGKEEGGGRDLHG